MQVNPTIDVNRSVQSTPFDNAREGVRQYILFVYAFYTVVSETGKGPQTVRDMGPYMGNTIQCEEMLLNEH